MVTGPRPAAMQIRVALGEKLDLSTSLGLRDPAVPDQRRGSRAQLPPGPGRITAYREPSGPFVRVDAACDPGQGDPSDYDSMFAKLSYRPRTAAARSRGWTARSASTTSRASRRRSRPHRWIPGTRAFRKATHLDDVARQAPRRRAPRWRDPTPLEVDAKPPVPAELLLEVDGRSVPVRIFDHTARDGAAGSPRQTAHGGEHVHSVIAAALMQGTILRVLVEPVRRSRRATSSASSRR